MNRRFCLEANRICIIGICHIVFSAPSSSPPADCSNKSVISGQPAIANPLRIYEPRNMVCVHPLLTSLTVVCPSLLPYYPPFSEENQILMQKCAHMVSILGWFPLSYSAPRKITSNSTRVTHLRATWTRSHRGFDPTTEITYAVQRLEKCFSSRSSVVVSHLRTVTVPVLTV